MNLKLEQKIKFWLSVIVKILVIALVIYKLIPFVIGNNNVLEKKEIITTKGSQKELNLDTINLKNENLPSITKPSKNSNNIIEISHILKYQGKILNNAYFKIENCQECQSSITGKDGIAKLNIDKKIIHDDNVLDFYIYASDTLVYHRAMRFSNLQFDKY